MSLGRSIPCLDEVVGALGFRDILEDAGDGVAYGVLGSGGGLAQPMLELGEEHLDRVQVGRVLRQEEEPGAGGADGLPDRGALVRAEVVHDDDVAGPQRRHQHPLDVEPEAVAVDRAVEEPGGLDAVTAQRGEEGHGLPVAMRHRGLQPLAARRPAAQRRHVGLGPGLVDEHQAGGIDPALVLHPLRPPARHVRTLPLGRDQRLFLCVSPSAWTNSHTVR